MASKPSKNVKKSSHGKGTVSNSVRDYSNEPFFVKKTKEAKITMERVIKNGGLPKELLDRMKTK